MNHGYADVLKKHQELIAAEKKEAAVGIVCQSISQSQKKAGSDNCYRTIPRTLADFERLIHFDLYPNIRKGLHNFTEIFSVGRVRWQALARPIWEVESTTILHYQALSWCEKCHRWRICRSCLGGWHQVSRSLGLGWYWCKSINCIVTRDGLSTVYRMQEDLPTFFPPSFNFQDLEKHCKERIETMRLGK